MQRFFGGFNRSFARNRMRYQHGVRTMLGRAGRMILIYAVLLITSALLILTAR